jgi:ribosomal protein L11 methyltransferase
MADSPPRHRSRRFPYFILLLPGGGTANVHDYLWQCGTIGFEVISESEHLEMLKVYFDGDAVLAECKKALESLLSDVIVIHSGEVDYNDWTSFLHGGFTPHEIGSLYIVPRNDPPPLPEGLKPLYIVPGRGFGTGSHPTTRLCVHLMTRHMDPCPRALDVGTGSGILAVAACKLGAPSVLAIDIDPDAVENAAENVEANGLAGRIELRTGSIDQIDGGPYPFVIVNIISRVLELLLEAGLTRHMTEDGRLLVSGIMDAEMQRVEGVFARHGFTVIERMEEGEWVAFLLQR